jgi:hypothetical protein
MGIATGGYSYFCTLNHSIQIEMQLSSFFKLAAVVASSVLVYGCSSTSKIPRPTEGYGTFNYTPTSSVVNVPIALSEKVLNAKINAEINGLLYQDNNMADDNMMVKVWKVQPIQVSLNGMAVDYRIPLKVWLKGGVTKLGITVAKEVELQIALKYHTAFSIGQDWSVSSKTNSTGFEWITNPEIGLAGFKIPIKAVADKIVNGMQSKVCSEIDGQIKSQFNVKSMIGTAWQQIQQPVLINKDYNVWLKLTPSEISATPFATKNGIISSTIGVKSTTEVLMSPKAPTYTPILKFPNFKVVQKPDGSFTFNLWTDLPYAEAEKMAMQQVKGQTFSAGSRKVTVNDIKIYGSDGKVIVAATLAGSFNGTVYFAGVPFYNHDKKAVEVKELDFEMQTRNILFKSAAWLFKSKIMDAMKEHMSFPVESYFKQAKDMANTSLKNNKSVQNLNINGIVDQIDIDTIYLTDKSFKVLGLAKGKLNVSLEGLNF